MFWHVFWMDCKRCFQPIKMLVIIVITAILIAINDINLVMQGWDLPYGTFYGSLNYLDTFLLLDKYKVMVAFLMGTLYTSSFCKDLNTNYLRSILTRVDVTTYVQTRILSNAFVIIVTTVLAFFAYVLLMLPKYPPLNINDPLVMGYAYYETIFVNYPLLFVLMAGFEMGMYIAVCSSIGIVFSSYQSNTFVSIGLTGFCFYLGLSYLPNNTPFDVLGLISMDSPCSWFLDYPRLLTYFWGILLESIAICICGYLFYRRMKWRMSNGVI